MKQGYRIFMLCSMSTLLITGCGAGITAQTAGLPEIEPQRITLPDLSDFGIDTSAFRLTDEPYVQDYGVGYDWLYEAKRPVEQWVQYQNDTGAVLAFDSQGRLRKFINEPHLFDSASKAVSSEHRSEAELTEYCGSLLRKVAPEYDSFQFLSQENEYNDNCAVYMAEHIIAENCRDLLAVQYHKDGTVKTISCDYADVPADTDFSAIANSLERYYRHLKTEPEFRSYERIEPTVESCYYKAIGGEVYGFFGITVRCIEGQALNPGEEYPKAGKGVILRAE